ncbi:MAG: thiopurine S-methyltransferase [Candidatus Thiodiazotropha sp.]
MLLLLTKVNGLSAILPGEAIYGTAADNILLNFQFGDYSVTGRDNQNWLRMWRNDQIEFHQDAVNPLLIRFWHSFSLKRESRIFVPMCGKSLDLLWLVNQGHEVIGVELSPLAVKSLFDESGIEPHVHRRKNFTEWEHGKLKILCGDFFGLKADDLGQIDAVYDRAALTALPEQVRKRYVYHLRQILPSNCSIFLLTLEDAYREDGCSSNIGDIDDEISALYGDHFKIQTTHTEKNCKPDPTFSGDTDTASIHKVYRLSPKT